MLSFITDRTISIVGSIIPSLSNGVSGLNVYCITGEEVLSQPYQYQVDLITSLDMQDSDAANLDLQAMIGHEVTVIIQLDGVTVSLSKNNATANVGAGIREISGIVTEASFVNKLDRQYIYRIIVEPWIVLAQRRTDYRIFQKKSVIDIIDEVLGGQYIYSYDKRLKNIYSQLKYEVQYGESDFDFIQRLMERSGIYWFFEHSDNIHRMILIDDISTHRMVSSEAYQLLPYAPTEDRKEREFIRHFKLTERFQSGGWMSDDFDFMEPKKKLTVTNSNPKKIPYNKLTVYEWPGNYNDTALGGEYARIRMEEICSSNRRYASGKGHLRNVVCGTTFKVAGYPQEEANCEYLVTRSKIEAEETGESSELGRYRFDAYFDVQPVSIPYRPGRKTPLPRTTGPQTAIVTGPPGKEIWTDQYGRVKLKFHWDRSLCSDHNSSRWVRVSYPWAGSNFGGVNIPRVGTEVIVDFKNGDPNHPIVTGRVYNAQTMPPWELPMNATQSGLISRSIEGGLSNANALRFEDRKGMEEIWLQAERDMLTEVKNDEVHKVLQNRNKSIDGDETVEVQGKRTENVGQDEKIEIGANRERVVKQNDTLNVQGDRQTSVQGNHQGSVQGTQQYSVGNDHSRSIGGNDGLSVTGNRQIQVSQSQQLSVQQDLSEQVNGNRSAQVGRVYSISANDKFELKVGSSSLVMESNGNISISGKDISINGSGSIEINGKTIDLN